MWNEQKGVFLNEKQEELTLDVVLAAEEYKGSYVAQYWINKELERRLADSYIMLNKYSNDLDNCEGKITNVVEGMNLYKKKYEDEQPELIKLRKEVKSIPLLKIGNFTLGAVVIGLGTVYIVEKLTN